MLVVVEGPDLSGKSTLAQRLATHFDVRYVKWPYEKHILEKCPDESGETFYKTLLQFANEPMVMDRGFLSNFVYCDFLNRQYDNEYIHEIVKNLKPIILYLHPTDEIFAKRQREEEFIDRDKLTDLRNCYLKHAETMKTHNGWDIETIEVNSNTDVFASAVKTVNNSMLTRDARNAVYADGKFVKVYSNYHKDEKATLEKLFNEFQFEPTDCSSSYDDDYEDILPRLHEVCELLKIHSAHRGAVVMNPKAERGDCICLWQLFIRDDSLHSLVYIRSSDIDRKLKQDLEMTSWLVKEVANKVGISRIEPCKVIQGSAHIYV